MTRCNAQCKYGTPAAQDEKEIQVEKGVLELASAIATGGASMEAAAAGAVLKAAIFGVGSAGLATSGTARNSRHGDRSAA